MLVATGRVQLVLAVVAIAFSIIASNTDAHAAEAMPYVVDGLALGGKVVPTSSTYRAYDCQPSEQYRDFTLCRRERVEHPPSGPVTTVTTILHSEDGTVAYVNRYIEPVDFSADSIQTEIDRLSVRFGTRPRTMVPPSAGDGSLRRIVVWGNLSLGQVQGDDVGVLTSGRSARRGFMVDYMGNFQKSAVAGLPVYYFNGGVGFVWNASVSEKGRASLRFFAMNADLLGRARVDSASSPMVQLPAPWPATPPAAPTAARRSAELTSVDQTRVAALSCDPCAADQQDDALRKSMLDAIERRRRAKAEADRFLSSQGHKAAMEAYLRDCEVCDFKAAADAEVAHLADIEKRTEDEDQLFSAAGDDIQKLRRYASDCTICAHLSAVVDRVRSATASLEAAYSTLKVCNQTDDTIWIAVTAHEDANSDMWIARGWFGVEPQGCQQIGTYARGHVYVFGKDSDGSWGGDRNICVADRKFSRVAYDNYSCSPDESLKKFKELELAGPSYTWTLTSE